jgi:hypothetical protein
VVNFEVAGVLAIEIGEFGYELAQFVRREARPDHRAMEMGIELRELGAPLRAGELRGRGRRAAGIGRAQSGAGAVVGTAGVSGASEAKRGSLHVDLESGSVSELAGEVHRMMSRLPPSISVPQYIIEYSGGQAKNRAAAFP